MADPRDLRPKTTDEIRILRIALFESIDQFIALTGTDPSMPDERLSYHEQMDVLDNQVQEFCIQHQYRIGLKLPRLILWHEGNDISSIGRRVQETVPSPSAFDKLAHWRSMGEGFARRRQDDNNALELAAAGQVTAPPRDWGLPRVGAAGDVSLAQLRAERAMRSLNPYHAKLPVAEAEKSRIDEFVASNLTLYKAWLNTSALDWFEADQALVPEHQRITWEHWCSCHAPYAFEQYFEPGKAPLLEKFAVNVREGEGLPTVSLEEAKRGREVFRTSQHQYAMSDESHQYLNAIRTGNSPPMAAAPGEALTRWNPVLERPKYDVGDADRVPNVAYGRDVESSGYCCDLDMRNYSLDSF